jgi:hypothetical protein
MESKLPPRYEFRRKAVGSRQTLTAMDVDDDLVSEFSDGDVIDCLRENNGLVSIETGLELKSPADLTGTSTSFPFPRLRTVFSNSYIALSNKPQPSKPLSAGAQSKKRIYPLLFPHATLNKFVKTEQATPTTVDEVIDLITSLAKRDDLIRNKRLEESEVINLTTSILNPESPTDTSTRSSRSET